MKIKCWCASKTNKKYPKPLKAMSAVVCTALKMILTPYTKPYSLYTLKKPTTIVRASCKSIQ